MKSVWLIVAMFAGFAGVSGQVAQVSEKKPGKLEARARDLVGLLVKEDFAAAVKDFDETMTKVLPAKKLEGTWKSLVKQVGPFQKIVASRQEKAKELDIVTVTCAFAKTKLDARWVFDGKGQVTGFFFRASKVDVKYEPPSYVKRDAFHEVNVTVGAGKWKLPGTLCIPQGDGPFPGVVLVQGSGPNDRDETIGPNQVFKDLAWGLASQKVAVLRYDKRTFVHGDKLPKDLTIEQEVIDDALAAVQWLRGQDKVKIGKIFLLGHSLGAIHAPRMAGQEPAIDGVVMLAAADRPVEDLILEQVTYIYSLEAPSDENKKELEKIRKQVERVRDPKLSPKTPAQDLPLGMPASYWLSHRGPSPSERAAKLKLPMLILQGERDYQVTMEDFRLFKKALAGHKNVTMQSYPALNHLFIAGEGKGKSRPEDYQKTGHVAAAVVADIAAWITKHR